MDQLGHIRSSWDKLSPIKLICICTHFDPFRPIETNWESFATTRTQYNEPVPIRPIRTNLDKLVPTWTNWGKCGPIRTYWDGVCPIWTYQVQYGPILNIWYHIYKETLFPDFLLPQKNPWSSPVKILFRPSPISTNLDQSALISINWEAMCSIRTNIYWLGFSLTNRNLF